MFSNCFSNVVIFHLDVFGISMVFGFFATTTATVLS
jgi:hypothetical protein